MSPSPILIVDDDQGTCVALSDVLTDLGYPVDIATGGYPALDLVARQEYLLALLDYRMPDLDGLEVFQRARQLRPDLVGVVVTAFASEFLLEHMAVTGLTRVLQKPINFGELLPVVEEVVGKPS